MLSLLAKALCWHENLRFGVTKLKCINYCNQILALTDCIKLNIHWRLIKPRVERGVVVLQRELALAQSAGDCCPAFERFNLKGREMPYKPLSSFRVETSAPWQGALQLIILETLPFGPVSWQAVLSAQSFRM